MPRTMVMVVLKNLVFAGTVTMVSTKAAVHAAMRQRQGRRGGAVSLFRFQPGDELRGLVHDLLRGR
jgi:hypothetical protein